MKQQLQLGHFDPLLKTEVCYLRARIWGIWLRRGQWRWASLRSITMGKVFWPAGFQERLSLEGEKSQFSFTTNQSKIAQFYNINQVANAMSMNKSSPSSPAAVLAQPHSRYQWLGDQTGERAQFRGGKASSRTLACSRSCRSNAYLHSRAPCSGSWRWTIMYNPERLTAQFYSARVHFVQCSSNVEHLWELND